MAVQPVRAGDQRKTYMLDHPLLVCLATVAALSGLVFLVIPGILAVSSLGVVLPLGLERGWAFAYFAGGALVIAGCWRRDARPEVGGLMLLAGCYVSYGYAVFANRGFEPGLAAASVFIGLSFGCLARAYVLRYEPENAPWRRRSS